MRDCMELGCCHDPVSGICTVDFTTYKIIAKVNLFFKKLIFIYYFFFSIPVQVTGENMSKLQQLPSQASWRG